MKLQKSLLALFLSLNGATVFAGQLEISVKIGKMADTLITAYEKIPGAVEKPKVAVLTFNTTKDMEKRRIGFAVAEILTHKLAEKGAFSLLERLELNRIFDELKLNQTGVTNQTDALNVGKLASAELLVMGSVEKFEGTYHVNGRLVKTETGDVLATAYVELPVETFENEAKEYVVRVPKTQTIGVYFLCNYRETDKISPTTRYVTDPSYDYTTIITQRQTSFGVPGIGLRYYPFEHLIFDVSLMNTGKIMKTVKIRSVGTDHTSTLYDYTNTFKTGYTFLRALAGGTGEFSRAISYFIGAGATSVKITGEHDTNYLTPTILARAEYHIQERIGVSISVGYDLVTKAAPDSDWRQQQYDIARLLNFYVEPTVSVYF